MEMEDVWPLQRGLSMQLTRLEGTSDVLNRSLVASGGNTLSQDALRGGGRN